MDPALIHIPTKSKCLTQANTNKKKILAFKLLRHFHGQIILNHYPLLRPSSLPPLFLFSCIFFTFLVLYGLVFYDF